MSTLKFKSKIEVPGIDVKGGNIENVGTITQSYGDYNTTITPGQIDLGEEYQGGGKCNSTLSSIQLDITDDDKKMILDVEGLSFYNGYVSSRIDIDTVPNLNEKVDNLQADQIACKGYGPKMQTKLTAIPVWESIGDAGDMEYYSSQVSFDLSDIPTPWYKYEYEVTGSANWGLTYRVTNSTSWKKDKQLIISLECTTEGQDPAEPTITLTITHASNATIQQALTQINQRLTYIYADTWEGLPNSGDREYPGMIQAIVPDIFGENPTILDIANYSHLGVFYYSREVDKASLVYPCIINNESGTLTVTINYYETGYTSLKQCKLKWKQNSYAQRLILTHLNSGLI